MYIRHIPNGIHILLSRNLYLEMQNIGGFEIAVLKPVYTNTCTLIPVWDINTCYHTALSYN